MPEKICLAGARARLSGERHRSSECRNCITVNLDPLMKVRTAYARPLKFLDVKAEKSYQASSVVVTTGAWKTRGSIEF